MKNKLQALSLVVGLMAACVGFQLHADPVNASPNPYNLLTQPRVMGDCYGCRPAVENHGVVLSAQSTSDLFGNTTGGAATGTTYSGLLNLGLAVDLQKAVGWEGASFKNTWLWLYGQDVSQKYVGNALTVSSIAGNPAFRCYELWFQQNLFHDVLSLRAGLLALDTEFFASDTASLFVNSTFGVPGLFSLNVPNGGPTYPLATPGVRLALQPTPWLTVRSALSQANPFSQSQNTRGFDWNFGPAGGLLSLNEMAATWNKDTNAKGLPGTAKAGFWLQTGQDLESAPGSSLDDAFAFGSPEARRYSSGFYGIIDQQLYAVRSMPENIPPADGKNPQVPAPVCSCTGKGLSGFYRIGFSPQQASQVGFYTDAGLVYTGLIPMRDSDKLGVAFGYAQMGSQYASLGSSQSLPGVGYEAVTELSYAMQLSPAISVQPDLQYILHPGGTQQYGNALVVGVRAVVNF
jgi:porin